MAITRAKVETELARRCGKLLTAAGLDATYTGTNANLNGGIRKALASLDIAAADPTVVADADLAAVTSDQYDQLFDVAELRVLEDILGNLDLVDIQLGPRREALGQLAERLEQLIERKAKQVERAYGVGGTSLTAGVIEFPIMEELDSDE